MLIVPVIGGFRRHEGNWDGQQETREILLKEMEHRGISPLRCRVFYKRWNDHWRDMARQCHLWRDRYHPEPLGVMVAAYSWGVGNGLVKFANALGRYGIDVSAAVCCDGVYRHPWLQWVTQWRAFHDGYRIDLPLNVIQIHGFYQRVNKPHGLALCDPNRCASWTELQRPHAEMDSAPEYQAKCLEVFREQLAIYVEGIEAGRSPEPQTVEVEAARSASARGK